MHAPSSPNLPQEANGRPDAVVAAASWDKYKLRNRSEIVDLFAGQLKSTLVCPTCARVSVKFDPYLSLALPLPPPPSPPYRAVQVHLHRTLYDASVPARVDAAAGARLPASRAALAEAVLAVATGGTSAGLSAPAADALSIIAAQRRLPSEASVFVAPEPGAEQGRWESLAFPVGRDAPLADIRRQLAAAAGVPPEALLLMWRPPARGRVAPPLEPLPEAMTADEAFPVRTARDRKAYLDPAEDEPFKHVYAYVRAPVASPARARALADAGTSAASAAVDDDADADDDSELVTVRLSHLLPRADDASDEPRADDAEAYPPSALRRESVVNSSEPAVVTLPRSATLAQLRLAAARAAVSCMFYLDVINDEVAAEVQRAVAEAAAATGAPAPADVALDAKAVPEEAVVTAVASYWPLLARPMTAAGGGGASYAAAEEAELGGAGAVAASAVPAEYRWLPKLPSGYDGDDGGADNAARAKGAPTDVDLNAVRIDDPSLGLVTLPPRSARRRAAAASPELPPEIDVAIVWRASRHRFHSVRRSGESISTPTQTAFEAARPER